MRFLRPPYLFLIAWTLLCALPIAWLIPVVTTVVEPGTCFEYCDLGILLGNGAIRLVTTAWLMVALLAVWMWNRGQPSPERRARSRELAGFAAILIAPVTGASFALLAARDYEHFAVLAVVAVALELVAATELGVWTRPPAVATTALFVMTVATLATCAALVYGTNFFNPFWDVFGYASVASQVALVVLIARATLHPIPGRRPLILVAVATLWTLLLYTFAVLHIPLFGPLQAISGMVLPILSAAAWILFGIATLRGGEASPPPATPETALAPGVPMAVQRPRTPPPFPRF